MKIKKRYLSSIKNIAKHAKIFMEEWYDGYDGSEATGLWSIYIFFNTPKYLLCSFWLVDDVDKDFFNRIKHYSRCSKFRILLNYGLEERLLKIIHEHKKEI